MQVDKKIYINSEYGDDTNGNGTEDKPYASLNKIIETGIIENGNSYAIVLMKGEYDLPKDIITLTNDKSINIFGNKKDTILNLPKTVIGNAADGAVGNINYSLNFYRLVVKDDSSSNTTNKWRSTNNVTFNNVVIINNQPAKYSLLALKKCNINNCISIGTQTVNIRCDTLVGTTLVTNSYGNFSSGYGTKDEQWNYQTNYITKALKIDLTTYRITDDESLWKNIGTGTNPDGTQANLGVYGGKYSWEE